MADAHTFQSSNITTTPVGVPPLKTSGNRKCFIASPNVGFELSRILRVEPSRRTGARQNKEFKVIVPRVVPRNLRRIATSSKQQEETWMKRHTSRNSHRDAKLKPSRVEDSGVVLRARTEEERRRRRRDWMIEQEKIDRHNKLKRKMAMEYEIRRARNMSLALPEGRCNGCCRNRSESAPSRYRRTFVHHTPEDTVLSKKFETPSSTTPLFKGPEGTKINSMELRKIKVDIRRKIPGRVATNELKRDIPNKEDVVLKRRTGEGSKPIFDREEIKRAIGETEEVEEHRSVVTVNLGNSENTLKRHSASLSPTKTRNHSPRRTWSCHCRYDDYPREHYIQPFPIYYGNFLPRPLMVHPWGPIRGPLGGNIHPPMMRRPHRRL